MKSKKYYAYLIPSSGKRGFTEKWPECEAMVKGVRGARYQSFFSISDAKEWLKAGANYEISEKKARKKLKTGLYFDAGTGRGHGVEISVTDENKKNLLHKSLPASEINRFGKHLLPAGFTNNYGELLALKHAFRVAEKIGVKKIFGDSKLIIDYWSKGAAKTRALPAKTTALIKEVVSARKKFEKMGGEIGRISGSENPADLGFHR